MDLDVPFDVVQADLVQCGWHPHRLVVLVDDSRSDALLEVRPWDTDGITGVRLVGGFMKWLAIGKRSVRVLSEYIA